MNESVCPFADCGFHSSDPKEFNTHMHAHDDSRAQAAADAITAQEQKRDDEAAREQAEGDRADRESDLDEAERVLQPFVRAVKLLLSDEKRRQRLMFSAIDLMGQLGFAEPAEPAKSAEPAEAVKE